MGQVTLEDGTASMVVRFYGDDWKRYRNLVKLDELVIIKGSAREDKFVPSGVSMSGRSLDVPATLRAKNGVTLLFKAEDPNFDFDTLKPILEAHRPAVDDAGCHVGVVTSIKGKEASMLFSKDWDVYLDQELLDELDDVEGISYELN